MSEKLSDSITKTVVDYVAKIHETEDEYIYETIKPFCRDTLKRTISKKELEEMLLRADRMKWIPCSEQLPEEHDSIFAKWVGTDKWNKCMFKKRSADVHVTIEFPSGERLVSVAHTIDGKWKSDTLKSVPDAKIIAWFPAPVTYVGE